MIIYFDTETTGLCPGRIVQLSYIMENQDGLKSKNFFFGVNYVEPSAVAVHGFTVEKLAQLSEGRTFSWTADEIYDDFASADMLVAHNFRFDLSFMLAEFKYLERQFRYNESFDSMKYFTSVLKLQRRSSCAYKYPKLNELMDYYEIFPYDVSRAVQKLYGNLATKSHDARFDTAAMYLAVNEGRKTIPDLGAMFESKL